MHRSRHSQALASPMKPENNACTGARSSAVRVFTFYVSWLRRTGATMPALQPVGGVGAHRLASPR